MSFIRSIGFLYFGNKNFTNAGYLKAAAHFDDSAMSRSLSGRVVAVTGANSGLGLATAHALAARGATLLLLCRSQERGAAAVEAVKAASGNDDVHLEVVDVSSLSSVSSFTTRFLASGRPLHLLINNAGVLLNERQTSAEGHELSFATNTLGTLALTQQLLPALEVGAPSRVVVVSSGGQYTAPLECKDFSNTGLQPWDGSAAYSRDKRRQVALAALLAQRWAPKGIGVYSMHPGWADTEGVRTSIPGFHKAFAAKLRTPEQGADTIIWLALEDSSKLQPGAFYMDRSPQPLHLPLAGTSYTPQQVDTLYNDLLALAGLTPTPPPPPAAGAGAAKRKAEAGGSSGLDKGGAVPAAAEAAATPAVAAAATTTTGTGALLAAAAAAQPGQS